MLPSPEPPGPTEQRAKQAMGPRLPAALARTEVAMQTSNVEVLWTARYDYEPGWTLSAHQHEFFQIIYCLGGRGTITIATDAHTLGPGKLFLIEPSRPH